MLEIRSLLYSTHIFIYSDGFNVQTTNTSIYPLEHFPGATEYKYHMLVNRMLSYTEKMNEIHICK